MTVTDDPRLRLAHQALGQVRLVDQPERSRRLLHVVDSHGRRYVVKQHDDAGRFGHELRAYGSYLVRMRDITPTLVAQDAASRTLLLSYLPGRDCDGITLKDQPLMHFRAGAALRRLHDSSPTSRTDLVGSGLAERMRQWIKRADHAGVVSKDERRWLLLSALRLFTTVMEGAVCHLDYQPRNWLLHHDELFILDFEHARPDARVRDFARLQHRHWAHHPRLRPAFLSGYGRALTDAEEELLHLFAALEAVTALVRGHETGNSELAAHGRALLNRLV